MTIKQIESIKALIAVILAALVASKVIAPDLSNTLTGIISAALVVYSSFRIVPPQKIHYVDEEDGPDALVDLRPEDEKYGGSA
jgi:hypothetical protein